MLEKPDLEHEKIIACLKAEFEISVTTLDFLPFGTDQNTAVYRAWTEKGTAYFVKLRRGGFDKIAATLPSAE